MRICIIIFCTLVLLNNAQFIETSRYYDGSKLTVNFQNVNPGEYYKNVTSPIYPNFTVEVTEDGKNQLTLRILNPLDTFEIPHKFPFPYTKSDSSHGEYDYSVNEDGNFFSVSRYDGSPVFTITNATVLSLLYSELHTQLLSEDIFGFGERRLHSFRIPKGEFSIWNHDFWEFDTQVGFSLYGAHPVILQKYNSQYHIVLLRSSRPMTLERTDDELIYRVTGGQLEFKIFIGRQNPKELIKQYHQYLNGWELHPFWSSGWHQSRWGYENSTVLKNVVRNYKEAKIPLEVIWTDLDYMEERKDFTLNEDNYPREDIQKITDRTKPDGVHWVPIVDPGIAVDSDCGRDLVKSGAYIKSNRQTKTPYVGVVWPEEVYFTDFNHPKAYELWHKCHKDWFTNYQIAPSGIWIDMNELANFRDGEQVNGSKLNDEIFELKDLPWDAMGTVTLEGHTIAIDALHEGKGVYFNGSTTYIPELDLHNFNGFLEQIEQRKLLQAIQNKTLIFQLSRSSIFGSGRFSAIWFGDNGSTWAWLRSSVYQMFNFNLFGIPFVGDDICGFNKDTTPQLCARWIQLGAFYPFARDHNAFGQKDQEPYLYEITKISAQKSIQLRYEFLKYYYYLFISQRDSTLQAGSGTIVDPLWFKYQSDPQTFNIETQFQLGNIIVNPVVDEQTDESLNYTELQFYVPLGAYWVSFENGQRIPNGWNTINRTFTDNAYLALEAGSVIQHSNATGVMRLREMSSDIDLIVVLNELGQASGSYMSINNYDDEETILQRCWNDQTTCIRNISVRTFKDSLQFTNAKAKNDNSEEINIKNIIIYRNQQIFRVEINVSSFTQSWQINF
ncbi:unnamed protein product [Paramecium octaurelia]|uniref:Alpha-glucosidase n=1 Tax=Paramecium octaurelia TaxID=43137 RepID=A0A8S1XJQ8_PAROT|nr:unnamed protein product [Paramecium octaurelia]